MTDTLTVTETYTGRVKWFDPAKGYGFVLCEGTESDVLLHANVLRNFGQSSVADGARIVLRAQRTQRGIQATEVLEIAPPVPETPCSLPDLDHTCPQELAALPLTPARVKWFDKGKGFGFANCFGESDDVFIHIEVLRRSGLADLAPGEALCLKVIPGRRGRMAAQVLGWEAAVRREGE